MDNDKVSKLIKEHYTPIDKLLKENDIMIQRLEHSKRDKRNEYILQGTYQNRIAVVNFLLLDGFTQKQIVDFFCKNKKNKYAKKLVAYHVKRLHSLLKEQKVLK